MSQENVEVVRLSIDAYKRGDWDEATAYLASDVVWEVGQELPLRGPDAVRDMWTRWNDGWERLDMVRPRPVRRSWPGAHANRPPRGGGRR